MYRAAEELTASYSLHRTAHQEREEMHFGNLHGRKRVNHKWKQGEHLGGEHE